MIITNNVNINKLWDNSMNKSVQISPTSSKSIEMSEPSQYLFKNININVSEESDNINKLSDNPIDKPVNIFLPGKITKESIIDVDLTNCTVQEAHQKMWYLYMNGYISWEQKHLASDAIGDIMNRLGMKTSLDSDAKINFMEALESTRSRVENMQWFDGDGEPIDSIRLFEELLELLNKDNLLNEDELLDKELNK